MGSPPGAPARPRSGGCFRDALQDQPSVLLNNLYHYRIGSDGIFLLTLKLTAVCEIWDPIGVPILNRLATRKGAGGYSCEYV